MKKTLYIITALLLSLVSCTQMQVEAPELAKPDETGLVAVTMKLDVPVPIQAFTKADRAEDPEIDYIRVAVFGTSGYPQTYAYAEPVDSYASTNGDTYTFKVLLPVYEAEAHVHIIANGDESIKFVDEDEDSIMKTMKSEKNVGAYWARVVLEDGILPQKDQYGIMQTDAAGNFIPSEETQSKFNDLTLIRNFAEVNLSIDQNVNLSNIKWTLVNIPSSGSVAPMSELGFVDDYKDYEYDSETGQMVNGSIVYEGFMYDGAMDFTVPSAVSDDWVTPGVPQFVYERPHPGSDKATCLLVSGNFTPEGSSQTDSYLTYYRIDLMDESVGGYFPLYRNYKYQIKIHKVGNRGATSIAEAMNRDSGGNVSMSTEAIKLTDISDGASRLVVEYTDKVFITEGYKTLFVQYIPDVTTGVVDNTNVSIKVKTQGTALVDDTITLLPNSSQTGYYYYQFQVNDQDENTDLTSVLQVVAHNGQTGEDKSTLYRDINIRVLKKMDFDLELDPPTLTGDTKKTVLHINLPDNMPSSVFPLLLYIEDVNHTLSPTQKDGNGNSITIPVQTAKSLADSKTNSFYYIRTVNESEYNANHSITTEFEAVVASSATTIYVANDYFKTHSINLLNDGIYVNPTHATVDHSITSVSVDVESSDDSKTWTVTAGSGVTVTPSSGTGSGSFTMTFAANNSTEQVVRKATVTSGGDSHDVYITQLPIEFSITPASQQVAFNTTTANVTIYAEEGQAWTARVTGPNGTNPTLSATSGEGTQTLTLTIPKNTSANARNYTVTAEMTDPVAITTTAQISQDRGPAGQATFSYNDFGITQRVHSGSADSTDGFVTVVLNNATRNTGWFGWSYIQMSNGNAFGTLTVSPKNGIRITSVVITFNSGYVEANPTMTTGSYSRQGNNGTWTVNSSAEQTFTFSTNGNNGRQITSIQINYEAE